jgi:cellulose synthase/poly-beta-1,6-N-acetylglucosamine synthase-like glycosyltransferase
MGRLRQLNYPIVGLIASKNPVSALEKTVQSLFKGGASRVIVVDDGSDDPESISVFKNVEAIGAEVIHLPANIGKARALKVGFRSIPRKSLIVQTDDDTLAGDLSEPARLLRERKADIVDVRVETTRTRSLIGFIQELGYWLINAIVKRLQGYLDARLWMSGASVMYNYKAGKELILQPAFTMTEDTEGLFRARSKGFEVKFCSDKASSFITMVPEDFSGLSKQWRRWTTGNGQVMGIHGLGGGDWRVAAVNILFWADLILLPIMSVVLYGFVSSALWAFGAGILMGFIGALRLGRPRAALVGMFFPILSIVWIFYALTGLYFAYRLAKSGQKTQLTWVSPKRTSMEVA